ncbi:MAG TPA: hypothetical protein EYP85_03820 [Armatimonadetes bacterium]|nr:hypothetical protein [Armatimonadota bacterium]
MSEYSDCYFCGGRVEERRILRRETTTRRQPRVRFGRRCVGGWLIVGLLLAGCGGEGLITPSTEVAQLLGSLQVEAIGQVNDALRWARIFQQVAAVAESGQMPAGGSETITHPNGLQTVVTYQPDLSGTAATEFPDGRRETLTFQAPQKEGTTTSLSISGTDRLGRSLALTAARDNQGTPESADDTLRLRGTLTPTGQTGTNFDVTVQGTGQTQIATSREGWESQVVFQPPDEQGTLRGSGTLRTSDYDVAVEAEYRSDGASRYQIEDRQTRLTGLFDVNADGSGRGKLQFLGLTLATLHFDRHGQVSF